MLRSMTGYGRGEYCHQNRTFTVEIKAVNHRYNDITIKLPRMMNILEERIRKTLQSQISRGKTDVYISFETHAKEDVHIVINEPLADSYVEKLQEIQTRYDLKDNISIALVAKFPDLISAEKHVEDESFLWELLNPALLDALHSFIAMREREGTSIQQDLLQKLSYIQQLVEKIRKRSPSVIIEYKERLHNRVSELLTGNDFDQSRLLTEITLFADRCAIDEELVRLTSHLLQLQTMLSSKEPIGRKLDFLIQEMNREANTIGSKANDLEIVQMVIDMKSEIEKIREQVQNIE